MTDEEREKLEVEDIIQGQAAAMVVKLERILDGLYRCSGTKNDG